MRNQIYKIQAPQELSSSSNKFILYLLYMLKSISKEQNENKIKMKFKNVTEMSQVIFKNQCESDILPEQ